MFLLRCGFWLAVVYVCIALGYGGGRPIPVAAALAPGETVLTGASVSGLADWCVRDADRCARDASRMKALVETVARTDADAGAADEPEAVPASSLPATVPLPVPDPRRAARATRP